MTKVLLENYYLFFMLSFIRNLNSYGLVPKHSSHLLISISAFAILLQPGRTANLSSIMHRLVCFHLLVGLLLSFVSGSAAIQAFLDELLWWRQKPPHEIGLTSYKLYAVAIDSSKVNRL